MTEAFYLPLADGLFLPTKHTIGPWASDAQHFGPPSALLVRALEGVPVKRESLLSRVTIEILGPAPLTELSLTAKVDRPGRSVELLSAELSAAGRTVAKAAAWRIATSDSTAVATPEDQLSGPLDSPPSSWPLRWDGGYFEAMEWRAPTETFEKNEPVILWARQKVALVEGEEPSPLQRLFAVADSGNGASSPLDLNQWWFINSELTVHLHRAPESEWIGLAAQMAIGNIGVGTATTRIYDTNGNLGVGAQALLIRRR